MLILGSRLIVISIIPVRLFYGSSLCFSPMFSVFGGVVADRFLT